ncbi:hypothetical protein BG015_003976 [Linnemannia schmuckeri]|uniref:Ceramide glucosyltransferase n=1 Tax=Linnemannia schmuckeri TaxID=64567 RepID=A0A9P5S2F9_9FUNG|nr:hypothetical protein BG015_003976 [Linnemannia schmuckeri]
MNDHDHLEYLTGCESPLIRIDPHPPEPLASVWERHSTLQLVCMVLSIFFWFFSFTAALSAIAISRTRYSGKHKRSASSLLPKDVAPGVSIIRPLRGVDCNMYENLASSFYQEYPRFEIIFSVAQSSDPAIDIVLDLMKKYPHVDARLIIGERNVGINPKINNMIRSYESAKYDILWIQDSNVYVDPGCMGRSVDKMMQPDVGLVHHLPVGVQPKSLGSELELMFLDTVHAKMYLFINWTGLASCVVGKSSLYRRSDLDKVGGLARFGKYMAEDNLVATEIFNMGYKHEMTSDLAYQTLGSMTTSDYFLRRARWTRIRKYTVTAATVVEPFIEMIGCGLVASYGFNLLWQTHFLNFLAFHIVCWFWVDLSMYQALSGEKVENLRGFLMAWSLRELAALPLFAYAVAGSTVDWRDQTFLLLRDATVRPLTPPPSTSAFGSTATTLLSSSPSTSTSFAHIANTVVPSSTQASLRSFFRRPAVISFVSSTLAVIHFVVDILIKSQRNGNMEEEEDEDEEDDMEDEEGVEMMLEGTSSPTSSSTSLGKGPRPKLSLTRAKSEGAHSSGDVIRDSETTGETVLRRSSRLKMLNSKVHSADPIIVKHDQNQENGLQPEGEEGERRELRSTTSRRRLSAEEDALSKAVEPYLSDSLSRRRHRGDSLRIRRAISASSMGSSKSSKSSQFV